MSHPGPVDQKEEAPASPKLSGAFERYQQAVSQQRVAETLAGRTVFSRAGRLSAWMVIWLIIFQRLHAKGTLAVAVRELLTGPLPTLASGRPKSQGRLSANTSAYSQARSKLPVDVAEQVSDWIFQSLWAPPNGLPGVDQAVFLLDGSSILLAHSAELVAAYPPPRNQHGASHWPAIRVVVAHDVVSGLATRPCWGPMDGPAAVSEQGLAKNLLERLPPGCILLGDRNFGVFSMAYHAAQRRHPCLFRLTEARARKLHQGVSPSAQTDRPIRWTCSREDRRSNPKLPAGASVEGRLLVFKVRAADGKRQKLYLFTSLDLPADQILSLYGYRWNIETDLRSLKREVRLHMLEAKSKAMVDKELVLSVAAYNLTRATIQQAASALHLDPRRFSFSLAQDTLNAFLPLFAGATCEQQRNDLMERMLQVLAQSKLPRRRKRRFARREIWPRPCPFPKRKVATKGKGAITTRGVA